MEKLTWDYFGWKEQWKGVSFFTNPEIQTDWNQTLITKINFMSIMIRQETHIDGANKIKINSELLSFFKELQYFIIDENNEMFLGNIYHITIDDSLPKNIILLLHESEENLKGEIEILNYE